MPRSPSISARRAAEERYLQNAADAGALAACNALVDGATDSTALQKARAVAAINLASSPAGSGAAIAGSRGGGRSSTGYAGNPYQMTNGALLGDESVFVAIDADVDTTIGRVLGRPVAPGARSCPLHARGGSPPPVRRPALQRPARDRARNFLDFVATEATSAAGAVDPVNPRGFDGRTPASELHPGPEFQMYGPQHPGHEQLVPRLHRARRPRLHRCRVAPVLQRRHRHDELEHAQGAPRRLPHRTVSGPRLPGGHDPTDGRDAGRRAERRQRGALDGAVRRQVLGRRPAASSPSTAER